MRHHPELHDWAADLVRFGEREELRQLGPALALVAGDAFSGERSSGSLGSTLDAMRAAGEQVYGRTLEHASLVAQEAAADSPYASFVLAWVAVCVWILG